MPKVVFKTPGEMNLVGYLLRSLIDRNLQTEKGARVLAKMKGTVLVGASDMRITLDFSGEDLVIAVGEQGKADARVCGNMDALLGVALGHGMVGPVLSGKLKVGGKVWRLLKMLKLLKVESRS
jgi:SCP-2 sterol transfer family protein